MGKEITCGLGCRYCKIFQGQYELGKIDTPMTKTEKYIALASLGSFIKGWTLIIPKEHIYCMKDKYNDLEFISLSNEIVKRIRKVYSKDCILFEHGANHEGSLTACGTNHAHIHIVPYDKSLLSEMKQYQKKWIECRTEDISGIVGDNEYWFYSENINDMHNIKGYLHIIEKPESQFFRKLLAKKENCIEKYDYKTNWFIEIAEETYDMLKD